MVLPDRFDIDRLASDIVKSLPLFLACDDVFEIRALRSKGEGVIGAGFFQLSNFTPRAARNILGCTSKARGLYFTPQQLSKDKLESAKAERSFGSWCGCRNSGAMKWPTVTEDTDVTARRFLVIDVDPVRSDGFEKASSTDAEKEAARKVAKETRVRLSEFGWPAPLVVDSGNGWHLYYSLAESFSGGKADSREDVYAQFLRVLSKTFSTSEAKIDTSIYNSSRILRLPGSVNRRGKDTDERPHRLCEVTQEPSDWRVSKVPAGSPSAVIQTLDPDGSLRRDGGTASKERQPKSTSVSVNVGVTKSDVTTAGFAKLDSKLERRVRGYLLSGKPAISGEGGHNRTLEAAQGVVNGFLLSREDAIHMMMKHFVPRSPADDLWSLQEIEHKVDEAFRVPCNHPRGWLINAPNPNAKRTGMEGTNAAEISTGIVTVTAPAPTNSPTGKDHSRPTIIQEPAELKDVVDEAVDALVKFNFAEKLTYFVHADRLVIVDHGKATVKPTARGQLKTILSRAARFVRLVEIDGQDVPRDVFPKSDVRDSVFEHDKLWPGIPRLTAVADVPLITAESGLLRQPGYDAASGVYLLPGGLASVPEVADAPTDHDVECARRMILEELLGDFPFADDASRANALALFLLPFVLPLTDGKTPLHHIDAPQEGTGKSLLIQTWGHVCEGREPAAIAEVTRPDDWQKLVLAALIEAPRSVFLDNLNHTLDSGPLAQAITSGFVRGRLLGYSRVVTAKANCVWVSTGNNVSMSREMVRRTLYIRLDAKQDTAWNGRKFRHKLPQWAERNRGELVWACLTLCQAWVAKGKPPGRSRIGGFEAWSAVIDGILCNAGITDLAGNADEFRNLTVDSGDEWRAFVPAWWREYQNTLVTPAELASLADRTDMLCAMLEKAVTERARAVKVGNELKKVRDRNYNGLRIAFEGPDRKGSSQYRLVSEAVSGAADGDANPLELDIPDE